MGDEWQKMDDDGFEIAHVGAFELSVSPYEPNHGYSGKWVAALTVYGADECGKDGGKVEHKSTILEDATMEDAKRAAIVLAQNACGPFVAQAVAAEREAVRAEIGQRKSTLLNEFVASESRANAINGELRALRLLVEWLDARSKGGAK